MEGTYKLPRVQPAQKFFELIQEDADKSGKTYTIYRLGDSNQFCAVKDEDYASWSDELKACHSEKIRVITPTTV